MTFDELVSESSLVAKVKIGKTKDDKHYRFKRIADVLVQDAIAGCAKGDRIKLRYDNGYACPNVTYKEGEEIVLFAIKDIDGTYSTVGYDNGKSRIDAATYSDRAAKIKKAADRIAVDVSLKTITSPEAGLEISILNKGADNLILFDQGYPDVRTGDKNPSDSIQMQSGYVVKLIVLVLDSNNIGVMASKSIKKKAPDITLKKNECCTGRVDIRRIPIYSSKTIKVRIWGSVGPHLSEPVEIKFSPKKTLGAKEAQGEKKASSPRPWPMNLKRKIIQQNAPADAKKPRR